MSTLTGLISSGSGGGVPINSTAALKTDDIVHTAADGSVWLRSGYVETNPAVYPLASTSVSSARASQSSRDVDTLTDGLLSDGWTRVNSSSAISNERLVYYSETYTTGTPTYLCRIAECTLDGVFIKYYDIGNTSNANNVVHSVAANSTHIFFGIEQGTTEYIFKFNKLTGEFVESKSNSTSRYVVIGASDEYVAYSNSVVSTSIYRGLASDITETYDVYTPSPAINSVNRSCYFRKTDGTDVLICSDSGNTLWYEFHNWDVNTVINTYVSATVVGSILISVGFGDNNSVARFDVNSGYIHEVSLYDHKFIDPTDGSTTNLEYQTPRTPTGTAFGVLYNSTANKWFVSDGVTTVYEYGETISDSSIPGWTAANTGDGCWDGTYYYAIELGGDVVYRLDANGTNQTNVFDATASGILTPQGMDWDGTYFYVCDQTGDAIYRYDSNWANPTSFSTLATFTDPMSMCNISGTYYIVNSTGSCYTTDSTFATFTLLSSGFEPDGLATDGTYLYSVNDGTTGSGAIKKHNASTGAVITNYTIPAAYTQKDSIIWNGTDFRVFDDTTNTMYKFTEADGWFEPYSQLVTSYDLSANVSDIDDIHWDGTNYHVWEAGTGIHIYNSSWVYQSTISAFSGVTETLMTYDGTYYYFASTANMEKYNASGTLIATADLQSMSATTPAKIKYHNGLIVSCASSSSATSGIGFFNADTLELVDFVNYPANNPTGSSSLVVSKEDSNRLLLTNFYFLQDVSSDVVGLETEYRDSNTDLPIYVRVA